jgi:hypothetical protein
MAADEVGQRRPAAFVRDMRDLDPGAAGEIFGAEMNAAAGARRGVVDVARLFFRQRDQFRNRMRRH